MVAESDAGLEDYNSSLCYEYPGPALQNSQVLYLPCTTAKVGRYVKVMMMTNYSILQIAKFDVFGY